MTRVQIEDAQGSALTWGTYTFPRLVQWDLQAGAVVMQDCTSFASPGYGLGYNARIQKQLDPIAVEPPTLEAVCLGFEGFQLEDRGRIATLSIVWASGSVSALAALTDFRISGQVGELLRTSCTFRFTGF